MRNFGRLASLPQAPGRHCASGPKAPMQPLVLVNARVLGDFDDDARQVDARFSP